MVIRRLSTTMRSLLGNRDRAYDPISYWNNRSDPNSDAGRIEERVSFDANFIRKNITPGDRVLELGPGVGRTFGSYSPGTRISTIDISRIYEDQLAKAAVDVGLTLEQHFMDDTSQPYPFNDNEFDVGVCFQVFIHQPLAVFTRSFSELARVCRKCIISVGLHTNTLQSASAEAPHVFRHDYITESGKRGKIIHNLLVKDQVLYFTLEDDTNDLWFENRNLGK